MATEQRTIDSAFGDTQQQQKISQELILNWKNSNRYRWPFGYWTRNDRALSDAGATVIVGSRDVAKAKQALAEVKCVNIIELDLSEPLSVDAFANEFRKSFKSCDILINNAGIMATPLLRNSLGYEMQFATNHLGHFQLTASLWNELRESGARVISLSSLGHRFSGIKFEDPNFITNPYEKWTAYGQSKTANSLFAVHLDKVGEKYGVRAFAVHPGRITSTDLSRFMSDEEIAATANATPANPKFVLLL